MTLPARWDIPEPLAACEVHAADGASIFVRRHGNPNGPRLVLSHGNGFSIIANAIAIQWSLRADGMDFFTAIDRSGGRLAALRRHSSG